MQEDAIECVRMAISSIGLCFSFFLSLLVFNEKYLYILCNCKEYCFCNYSRITLVEKLTCARNTRTLSLYLVVTVYRILEYSRRFLLLFFFCVHFLHFISYIFFGEFANNNCLFVNSSFLIGAGTLFFFRCFFNFVSNLQLTSNKRLT